VVSIIAYERLCREMLKEKYGGKLDSHYEGPVHGVVAQVFRGLTGRKINTPSKDFQRYRSQYLSSIYRGNSICTTYTNMPSSEAERSALKEEHDRLNGELYLRLFLSSDYSHHQQSGVKCSIKANEGHLYCLEKAFMFVPKPATYISYENVSSITMSRVGGALAASRTFDITVSMKGGAGEHQFSNINR
jgi:Histone chaperone Rttp106-like